MRWLQAGRIVSIVVVKMLLLALPAASNGLVKFVVRGDAVDEPLGGVAGDAARGRGIVLDRRKGNCLICHSIPSVKESFQGVLGPSLRRVAKRLTVAQIRLRIIDQSRINPATIMPPFYRVKNLRNVASEYRSKPALNIQDVEDVVAYLATLKE